jgi:hypothetical protein
LRALVSLVVLAGAYLAWRWLLGQPQASQVRIGAVVFGLLLVSLAAIGRLPWALGLVGALLPLLIAAHRHYRQGPRDGADGQDSTGQRSVVETRLLRMTLDHATGEMTGSVLQGRFAGRELHALSQEQLLTLLTIYEQEDAESASLLRAYLDREHGTDGQDSPREDRRSAGLFGEMTRSEAYAILGLEEGVGEEQIREAHRRLMQKLHPDRGGSTFLAAKINQAKDCLLNEEA